MNLYATNPTFVVPDFRFNEVKAFVSRGLEDFSISRLAAKMPWGIPVPDDAEHVMYVWFDALTNYISTLGWPSDAEGNFKKYWEGGMPTQYCGKDNLRFQSAMWQAMLMAGGVSNSHQIVINGFITADGGLKMSKTLGNVVDPKEIVAEYGTDALRFFLAKEISNFEDSPFTMERFKAAYNAHLANGLGNLTSRILKMASVNLDKPLTLDEIQSTYPKISISEPISAFDISKAIQVIFADTQDIDTKIQVLEPFKVIKVDKEKGIEIIKNLVGRLYHVADALTAFMPVTSQRIKSLILENKMPETPLFMRKD